jgi:hypothetical protein
MLQSEEGLLRIEMNYCQYASAKEEDIEYLKLHSKPVLTN